MKGTDSIRSLKGIGDKTEQIFHSAGIATVDDLVTLYPRYYLTYEEPVFIADAQPGIRIAVYGKITNALSYRQFRGLKITTCNIRDHSGSLGITWYNMPYMRKQLHQGDTRIFVGTPVMKNGRLVMEHPECYTQEAYEKQRQTLQPVYPLAKGLTNKMIVKAMSQTIPYMKHVEEYLPQTIVERYHLQAYGISLQNVHFPTKREDVIEAKKRLIFDEFFIFLAAMRMVKEKTGIVYNHYPIKETKESRHFMSQLPFRLTNAQRRALDEMIQDLRKEQVMNRLVQGDVGSGKTILAVILLLMTATNGYQGALMAPTEVLAVQHYETFCNMLEPYHIRIALLTGSTKAKEKQEIYQKLKDHELDLVIGTHALIQEKVEYHNLALVITDEQHRFGVRQREAFYRKGLEPHVLVMSATPIPRTLALIMYGDLDISIIDELPANRLPIKNCVVNTSYRPQAYRFIEKQVQLGHQVYVICPMVEESENMDAENVTEYTKILQQNLSPSVKIESLNGRMKATDKNRIMDDFGNGKIDVLVSTTVIEVGINVPNATVMMVENAERFGLAQLHQLRGRIGRGSSQSYCIFIQGKENEETKKRLEILNKSNDGFYIANEDLKLRGPGDFFGVRQSGMMDFVLADIYQNADMLKMANDAVELLEQQGFSFQNLQNEKLKKQLELSLQL
ncbi:MAG: ATP-dependent DNA helicase RecG [Lachnospiraceae bacterium]|nr:ATP-dependent DNA helicase RecG [Lachnospiraceae bacterium]